MNKKEKFTAYMKINDIFLFFIEYYRFLIDFISKKIQSNTKKNTRNSQESEVITVDFNNEINSTISYGKSEQDINNINKNMKVKKNYQLSNEKLKKTSLTEGKNWLINEEMKNVEINDFVENPMRNDISNEMKEEKVFNEDENNEHK